MSLGLSRPNQCLLYPPRFLISGSKSFSSPAASPGCPKLGLLASGYLLICLLPQQPVFAMSHTPHAAPITLRASDSLLYVLIASEHNLAELHACLNLRPGRIWVISSPEAEVAAKRLRALLAESLPNSHCELITGSEQQPLDANSGKSCQAWIERELLPRLPPPEAAGRRVLNMTGGTKLLAHLLATAYRWSELHYQAFNPRAHAELQRFTAEPNGQPRFLCAPSLEIGVTPEQHARLYCDDVKRRGANPFCDEPGSLELAEWLHSAGMHPHDPEYRAWRVFAKQAQTLWFDEKYDDPFVTISWDDLGINATDFAPLMTRLNALWSRREGEPYPLQTTERGLQLPTKVHKASKKWRDWLAGIWFEQLLGHWLDELGVAPEQRLQDVALHVGADDTGLQADFVVEQNGVMHVLEAKVALPPDKTPKTLEAQISIVSGYLGKVNKVLVVAPQFKCLIRPETWNSFINNCQNRNVRVCVANQPSDLGHALGLCAEHG